MNNRETMDHLEDTYILYGTNWNQQIPEAVVGGPRGMVCRRSTVVQWL